MHRPHRFGRGLDHRPLGAVPLVALGLLAALPAACRGSSTPDMAGTATPGVATPASVASAPAAVMAPATATPLSPSALRATERVAALQPVFSRSIGVSGIEPGQLRLPFDVAVAPAGQIYVSDSKGVQEFTPDGRFVRQIGGDDVKIAQGLAVATDGTLYVAGAGSQVRVFDAAGSPRGTIGQPGTAPGQLQQPVDVAVDRGGDVYVADDRNGRVEKFAPDGRHLLTVGTPGEGREQLSRPRAVAVDGSGLITVGQGDDFLVKRFRPDGSYLDAFGRSHADENMWRIGGLAFDEDDNAYLTQVVGHRIQSFSPGDRPGFRWEFGALGFGPGQFNTPTGLAIANGELYVADQSNDRIQVFQLP